MLPLVDLLEALTGNAWRVELFGDNTAAKAVIHGSRSKELRHLARTHRISVRSLQEIYEREHWQVEYIQSDSNKADIFTKAFSSSGKWEALLRLPNIS